MLQKNLNAIQLQLTSKKYDRDNPPLYCSKCKSASWDRESNTRGTMYSGKDIDRERRDNTKNKNN